MSNIIRYGYEINLEHRKDPKVLKYVILYKECLKEIMKKIID